MPCCSSAQSTQTQTARGGLIALLNVVAFIVDLRDPRSDLGVQMHFTRVQRSAELLRSTQRLCLRPAIPSRSRVLESGWFKHETGHYNILGAKADRPVSLIQPAQLGSITTARTSQSRRSLRTYDSATKTASIELVERWYRDYRGLQRRKPCQQSVGECCRLLMAEGYCHRSSLCV